MNLRAIPRRLAALFLLLALLPLARAGAQQVFSFVHEAGDQWHLNVTVEEEVLVNGERYSQVEILNRIAAEVLEGEGGAGRLWNRYHIAEKNVETGVYQWSSEHEVRYDRDERGRHSGLPADAAVPAVRDVPFFPETPLSPGDLWSSKGREVFDLWPGFGIPALLSIDFTARYGYVGPDELDGKDCELIEIAYDFLWRPDPADPADALLMDGGYYPFEVQGTFQQRLWWDARRGRAYAVDGVFAYTYLMSDGMAYTFRGRSRGTAVYADPLDREALVREIEDIGDEGLRAEATAEGVKVSLEDINFHPDRAEMLPGQEEKLRGILEILSRYPERDIQVIGHTARIAGLGDGRILSEQRAETVARYILESGVREQTQIITRGMGNSRPIGDNATELGRRRNRRVEIIILEN